MGVPGSKPIPEEFSLPREIIYLLSSSKRSISPRHLLMWPNALMSPTQKKQKVEEKMFGKEQEDGGVEGEWP